MNRKSAPYEEELFEYLQDPHNAAGYLTAIIEDGDREAFLLALHDTLKLQAGSENGRSC